MNKRPLYLIIGVLVLMNMVALFFLFRPHRPPFHGKRPPSIIEVLNIEGKNNSEIEKLEEKHFTEKSKLMDEMRETKRKLYSLIGKETTPQSLDSLLSIINSKHYQAERMTFIHFQKIRKLLTSEKQNELDEFVLDVIANQPRPPRRK